MCVCVRARVRLGTGVQGDEARGRVGSHDIQRPDPFWLHRLGQVTSLCASLNPQGPDVMEYRAVDSNKWRILECFCEVLGFFRRVRLGERCRLNVIVGFGVAIPFGIQRRRARQLQEVGLVVVEEGESSPGFDSS